MKIGEFAKCAQVSKKMLRHYDAIGLFCPNAVDEANGYRLYSPDQLNELKWILTLKMLDFSLEEIRMLLSGPVDSAKVIEALAFKRMEIDQAFKQTLMKSLQIDLLLKRIQEEGFHMNQTIDLTKLTEASLLDIKKGIPNMEMLIERAQSIIQSALSSKTFGFIRVDLRQFKAINDIDGYEVGDRVIVSLYKTIESILENEQTPYSIARAGGDEFVVFAEGSKDQLMALTHSFKAAVNAIDYQSIGCHKPIDIYLGCVIANKSSNYSLMALIDDTYNALIEAHKKMNVGEPAVEIVDRS